MIVNNIYKRDFIYRMESLLPKDKNFYHIDVNQNIFTEVDTIKDEILNTDLCIVFNCAMEGYKSVIERIYNKILPYNISPDKVMLVSGATDIQKYVNEYAQNINQKPFKAVWMREFEHFVSINTNKLLVPLKFRKFAKSFLCLNRRWRLQRPVFVSQLIKNDLLQHGFVSLDVCEIPNFGWDDIKNSILTTHKDEPEISEFIINQTSHLKKMTPLLLDTESHKLDKPWQLQPELDMFYDQTYFSVVTETNYYTNQDKYVSRYGVVCEGTRFLTEKTFKPMSYQHPFILVSTPNMLSLLRDLGYKTFHPYINESYDTIKDDGQRMLRIIEEIKRVATLKNDDLALFLDQVQPIVEHNFNVLRKRYYELFDSKYKVDFRS